jgi:hypothetical protein
LTAPRRGIKKRHDAKRAGDGLPQPAPNRLAFRELGILKLMGVEHEIPGGDQGAFPTIGHAPVDEKCPFVLEAGQFRPVFDPQVAGFVPAKTVLRLPPRKIRIYKNIAVSDEPCAATDHQHQTGLNPAKLVAHLRQPLFIKKIRHGQAAKKTKDRIFPAQKGFHQSFNLFGRLQRRRGRQRQLRG